ncbi:MAG: tetratricopeptide repeat protein [Thauera sp.]|jgi:predicted negative regulator of RcsB-dependent stress response|nr:tetratricopeptide repeat protein [Thauera sp.]
MAVYDLEEQEQISALKAWWEQYGNLVVGLISALALASVGWQGWQWYQNRQAGEAGGVYFLVQQAAESGQVQLARDNAGRLISDYPRTSYAQLGALLAAGVQVRAGELDNAQAQLSWAAEEGKDAALRDLARLRLAALLLQKGEHDAALARLQAEPAAAFAARFADLRGDVYAAQGKAGEARQAWQGALDAISPADERSFAIREIVRIKLDALEG